MESKRKANGHAVESDDRSLKRRKVADIDLSKGETPETTTAYGLAFLEQIRRTADKSGRLVAKYFETLLPREGNAEYYKQTRLPISLESTETKLNNGEFNNLSELEGDFKRMICNAKEFYPRSSQVFEDAERVRKALSNFMTKTNPAYNTRGYQAVPTPLPPEDEEEQENQEENAEDEEGGGEEEEEEEEAEEEDAVEEEEVEEDADGEEEEKVEDGEELEEEEGEENDADGDGEEEEEEKEEQEEEEEEDGADADEDAEGEEENVQETTAKEENDKDDDREGEGEEIEVEDEEGDEDGDGDEDEAEDEEGEEEAEPRSRRKAIILRRRKPGRPPKKGPANKKTSKDVPQKNDPPPTRPDHEYEDVPYKGLTFQQAQEKIIEELLRYKEPEYYDAYFEPFVNLPPRSLRDYFKVISDPISLKKLQKSVKGIQGRQEATGISEFKSWSSFEEKSKLLWTNAYFYNEEGSEIYSMAQDLEKQFYIQFKRAQAAVSEPAQPKIKLKVGQAAETPGSSKKITIHVGGRGGSAESPAPQKAPSTEPANGDNSSTNGIMTRPTLRSSSSNPHAAARDVSITAASPTPGGSQVARIKAEESAPPPSTSSPMPLAASTPGGTPAAQTPGAVDHNPALMLVPQPMQNIALANGFVEQRRFRAPGKGFKDALISSVRIQTHPHFPGDRPTSLTVLPHAKEMQQSATISLPPNQNRLIINTTVPQFLRDRQYSLWMLINKQPLKQYLVPVPNQPLEERNFDITLHPGLNVLEAHLIAAIPRSEREPGGAETELEVFTILVNVTRTF